MSLAVASPTPFLSIVSPVYKAAEIVPELVRQLHEEAQKITPDFEILLIEDGSPDNSWQQILQAATTDSRIKGLRLSRNFGQHSAITAGLRYARGQYVIVIDCDLQDDPKYMRTLLAEAQRGFDVVYTRKINRAHSFTKNFTAKLFHSIFNWLAASPQIGSYSDIGSYSILSRKVVDAFCEIEDQHRHYLLILRWLGFPSSFIDIEHAKRFHGRSSYSLHRLINHAIDGITSQSTRLLHLSIGLGLAFCALALITTTVLFSLYFLRGFKEGWTSVVVLILLSTGMILLSLGVIGIYLGKTFDQVRGRPLFVLGDSINLPSANHSDSGTLKVITKQIG